MLDRAVDDFTGIYCIIMTFIQCIAVSLEIVALLISVITLNQSGVGMKSKFFLGYFILGWFAIALGIGIILSRKKALIVYYLIG